MGRKNSDWSRSFIRLVDAFESGLLVRVTGDIIALSPPLIATTDHIDELVTKLRAALGRLA